MKILSTALSSMDIRIFQRSFYMNRLHSGPLDERKVKRRLSSGQYEVGCKVPLSRSCTAFSYPNIQSQYASSGTKQLTLTVIDSGNASKVMYCTISLTLFFLKNSRAMDIFFKLFRPILFRPYNVINIIGMSL